MKRSRLKNKANRPKDLVEIANYKKQCDLVVSLNRQAKSQYFNEVSNFKAQGFSGIGYLQVVLFK